MLTRIAATQCDWSRKKSHHIASLALHQLLDSCLNCPRQIKNIGLVGWYRKHSSAEDWDVTAVAGANRPCLPFPSANICHLVSSLLSWVLADLLSLRPRWRVSWLGWPWSLRRARNNIWKIVSRLCMLFWTGESHSVCVRRPQRRGPCSRVGEWQQKGEQEWQKQIGPLHWHPHASWHAMF